MEDSEGYDRFGIQLYLTLLSGEKRHLSACGAERQAMFATGWGVFWLGLITVYGLAKP